MSDHEQSSDPPASDKEALQAIIDDEGSSSADRMRAIELKARLDGKIGHGRGERPGSEMTREELELFVSEGLAELDRRKTA